MHNILAFHTHTYIWENLETNTLFQVAQGPSSLCVILVLLPFSSERKRTLNRLLFTLCKLFKNICICEVLY